MKELWKQLWKHNITLKEFSVITLIPRPEKNILLLRNLILWDNLVGMTPISLWYPTYAM